MAKKRKYTKNQSGRYEQAKDSAGNLLFEPHQGKPRRGNSAWRRAEKRIGNLDLIKKK
jgi:hypothetical protein